MSLKEVVSVFLRSEENLYLMQLRDDEPSIVFPGHWGLFGGTIEIGESTCQAASRELKEEIGIHIIPEEIFEFRQYIQNGYLVHTCLHNLKIPLSKLNQKEGSDLGYFSINDILKGELFSQKFQSYFFVADPLKGYFEDFSKSKK